MEARLRGAVRAIVRGGAVATIGLAAVAVLSGCGFDDRGVADSVVQGVPDGWNGPQPDLISGEPVAGWIDDSSFGIVTFGSGSCPPIADDITVDAADTVTVEFRPSPRNPCTADMTTTTHIFSLPDSVVEEPVTIVAVIFGEQSTLVLDER